MYDRRNRSSCICSPEPCYRLPVVAEGDHTYLTEKDLEPWLGQGEPIFTCGDSVLLLVADQAKEYFVIPVRVCAAVPCGETAVMLDDEAFPLNPVLVVDFWRTTFIDRRLFLCFKKCLPAQ